MINIRPNKNQTTGVLDYSYGKTIRSSGVQAINDDTNYAWATSGARLGGKSWVDGFYLPLGISTLPVNCMFRPSRSENRGLSGFTRVEVWIESEGGTPFEVQATEWVAGAGGGPQGSPFTKTGTGPSARGWIKIGLTLPVYAGSAYRILVNADAMGSQIVYAVQVVETPYQNLESTSEALFLGDAWIGPYPEGAALSASDQWSTGTNDPASNTLPLRGVNSPLVRHGLLPSGVKVLDTNGSGEARSTSTFSVAPTDKLICALAFDPSAVTTNGWLAYFGSAIRIYRASNTWFIYHYDDTGSSTITSFSFTAYPAQGDWLDIVVWAGDGKIVVWINGERKEGAVGVSHATSSYYARFLGADYLFAMPALFAGQYTEEDALAYVDYRRHVHGIF